MKKVTVQEATKRWVREFNNIEYALIENVVKNNIDDFYELTPIAKGNYVNYNRQCLEVVDTKEDYENFNSTALVLETHEDITVCGEDVKYVVYNEEELEIMEVEEDEETGEFYLVLEGDIKVNAKTIEKIIHEDEEVYVVNVMTDGVLEFELDKTTITVESDDVDVEREGYLPMWGTLWTFGESLDEDWAREHLQEMANLGFRIYEYYPTGKLYFGIDGAGYDFYEAHWIPLYKARGLHWHNVDEIEDAE